MLWISCAATRWPWSMCPSQSCARCSSLPVEFPATSASCANSVARACWKACAGWSKQLMRMTSSSCTWVRRVKTFYQARVSHEQDPDYPCVVDDDIIGEPHCLALDTYP